MESNGPGVWQNRPSTAHFLCRAPSKTDLYIFTFLLRCRKALNPQTPIVEGDALLLSYQGSKKTPTFCSWLSNSARSHLCLNSSMSFLAFRISSFSSLTSDLFCLLLTKHLSNSDFRLVTTSWLPAVVLLSKDKTSISLILTMWQYYTVKNGLPFYCKMDCNKLSMNLVQSVGRFKRLLLFLWKVLANDTKKYEIWQIWDYFLCRRICNEG